MTQKPENGDVFQVSINKIIYQQARKRDNSDRVSRFVAALIVAVALYTFVPAKAQIGASVIISINDAANLSSYSFPSDIYFNDTLYICFTSGSCAGVAIGGLY